MKLKFHMFGLQMQKSAFPAYRQAGEIRNDYEAYH